MFIPSTLPRIFDLRRPILLHSRYDFRHLRIFLIISRRTRAYCIRMHQVDSGRFVLNLLYGNHRTLWPGAEKKRRMVLFVYFRHFRLGKKYSLTCRDVPHGYDTSISHIRASVILDGFVEYVEQK